MPDIDGANIKVPPTLGEAGAHINGVAQQIEDRLSQLKLKLAPIEEIWSGEAHKYYQGLQMEWNIAANGLMGPTGVLGVIARTMNMNWANYTDCEWTNVRNWKR